MDASSNAIFINVHPTKLFIYILWSFSKLSKHDEACASCQGIKINKIHLGGDNQN